MGNILTGDQAKAAFRKLGEIARQLGQDEYPYDPDRLLGALQAITEGRFETVGGSSPSLIHALDLIPEYTDEKGNTKKWEIVEDVAPSQFDISQLKPLSFLKNGEEYITSEEMCRRAVEFKANLGLADGKRMLADGGKLIPKEFRDFYIPLSGTLLRGPRGGLYVPYLYWYGGRWALFFGWLGNGWDGGDRFACSE